MAQPLPALHSQPRTPKDYAIGVICALAVEKAAFQAMLDDVHDPLPTVKGDENSYTFGRIGVHNVVVACLPAGMTGNNSAATVAKDMLRSFPIKIGLMVGVGGGVWSKKVDMRLGDVVVSQPDGKHGGVVQWDFGKIEKGGIFKRTGSHDKPPRVLLNALQDVKMKHMTEGDNLAEHLSRMVANKPFMAQTFGYQGDEHDQLYQATYDHIGGETCEECDPGKVVKRLPPRTSRAPKIYYGNIASGNEVMKHGLTRDRIAAEEGIICFEMEAAGLMDSFPCLVIRGVCDYADSHKNKRWQPYAAGTAAAYAKELLLVIRAADVVKTQTADEATREQMHSFYLPFLQNRQFVGRSAELDTLKKKLLVNKDCQKVAISGLGGIGKTQVALQFAYSVKEDCPEFSIFWVQALSMETFEKDCMEMARALGIHQGQESKEDVKKLVRQRLCAKTSGKWLLIVDNADDLDLLHGLKQTEGLLAFLPESNDGLTIFTTRHGGVAQHLAGSDVVEIGKMTGQETMDLLEKSLVRKSPSYNNEIMMNLLTELEYLPLAITQAAAYINTNKSSISEYLRLLKNTEQDAVAIMSTDFGDKTRYQNLTNAVAKTWTITFNKILERNALAADLLAFISCIEWKAIPYSILPAAHSEARLAVAIGTLCSYSFLERRDNGTKFDMHRLVHLATRIWVSQNSREAETSRAALKHLSEVFPSDDYMNREIWRDYLPHVARIDKDEQCQGTDKKSELCLKVGKCLYVDGRMKEAVLWLEESCEWRNSNLTEDHPDRLASQHELARAYQANGQVKEAVKLLEHVVAIDAKVLAKDHPDRLASQHELARAYQANGQVKEAVKLLEHVVAIEAKVLAGDHPNRLASQHELAGAYQANRQVKEAVKLLEHVVIIKRKIMVEDHPDRLASQHVLAMAYHANGQVKEAVKLLEHVVAIRAKVLAEDHPDRLASQHVLARVYQANGQVKEAVKLLKHVVAIEAKVLAEDHPSRLVSEELLMAFYHNVPWRSKTRQASEPSIENFVAEDEEGQEFNQALEVPQAIFGNNGALGARSSADKELKSSSCKEVG